MEIRPVGPYLSGCAMPLTLADSKEGIWSYLLRSERDTHQAEFFFVGPTDRTFQHSREAVSDRLQPADLGGASHVALQVLVHQDCCVARAGSHFTVRPLRNCG